MQHIEQYDHIGTRDFAVAQVHRIDCRRRSEYFARDCDFIFAPLDAVQI